MVKVLPSRKLFKLAGLAALVLGLALGPGPAFAITQDVIWDLGCVATPACQNTSYASPHDFSSLNPAPNYTLSTSGFDGASTPHSLFSKFTLGDPGETGLGLLGGPNNEIGPAQHVNLVVPAAGAPGWTLSQLFHLTISSVQDPEHFSIYRDNNGIGGGGLGIGDLLFGDETNASAQCSGTICNYIIDMTGFSTLQILGITDDVLIAAFTTQQTSVTEPEPATLLLLGLGLFAASFVRRRRNVS